MLLNNNLYHIVDNQSLTVRFNVEHPIFAGHFPGQPVVPGACLVQISEELLSQKLDRPVQLTGIRNLKFRRVITPDMNISFNLNVNGDSCAVVILHLNEPYAQFTATYMCVVTDL